MAFCHDPPQSLTQSEVFFDQLILPAGQEHPAAGVNMRLLIRALLFYLAASSTAAAQTLRITHIDVEQGAATLFVAPSGATLLVDTGKNGHGGRLKAALGRAGVTRIDHLIITHYHEDHFGGADDLVGAPNAVEVVHVHDRGDKAFLDPDDTAKPTYIGYDTALGHRAHHLMRGETIALDPAMLITCIASGNAVLGEEPVSQPSHLEENDYSIGLLMQFVDFRFFIGGDMHETTEQKIADRDLVMDVDVYQANHHGSHTSSSHDFITDMKPSLVVISNGTNSIYKHPRQVTLNALSGLSPPPTILQTNKFLEGGEGGNVADEFIADLVPSGADGDIVLTVNANGSYSTSYRGMTRQFQTKPRAGAPAPIISIASLVPNPVGDDRALEEVELRSNAGSTVDLVGWFLRDASGRVWTLSSLDQVAAGASVTIKRAGMAMSLDNGGDTIELLDSLGAVVDRMTYGQTAEGIRVTH
jgi:beta-lactamase superfamily II metal-dependent hydrolase